MLVIEASIDLPLLGLALGFFPEVAFALYLVPLLTALVQAGIFFMRVVGSLLVAAVEPDWQRLDSSRLGYSLAAYCDSRIGIERRRASKPTPSGWAPRPGSP